MGLVNAHPLLAEEYRAGIIDFDGQSQQQVHRRQHKDANAGQKDIKQPFSKLLVHTIFPRIN